MALTGYPDKVDVKLSYIFTRGGGNGLTGGDVITLYRTGDTWYEKAASTTPNTTDNRIKMILESSASVMQNIIGLVNKTNSALWVEVIKFFAAGASMGDYNNFDLWNAAAGGSIPGAIIYTRIGVVTPSLVPSSAWYVSGDVYGSNNTKIELLASEYFSTMEQHYDLVDKTVYPFE